MGGGGRLTPPNCATVTSACSCRIASRWRNEKGQIARCCRTVCEAAKGVMWIFFTILMEEVETWSFCFALLSRTNSRF